MVRHKRDVIMAPATGEVPNLDLAVRDLQAGSTLWIALSGGLDSVCLLHLANDAVKRCQSDNLPTVILKAVHVNHHLQHSAEQFERECEALCNSLSIPLLIRHVSVPVDKKGIEAAARDQRYSCFDSLLEEGDVLWLAHHRNDQAETFLLRVLRGAGLTGLSGMPRQRSLGKGQLQRPLLDYSRDALHQLGLSRGWKWVEDPSNTTLEYARNRLRHCVIPEIERGWPDAVNTLSGLADHLRDCNTLLDEYAAEELSTVTSNPACIPMAALVSRTPERSALLIRCALKQLSLEVPPRARMTTLLQQLDVTVDKSIEVKWAQVVVRSWKGYLYLMSESELLPISDDELKRKGERWLEQMSPVHESGQAFLFNVSCRTGGERLFQGGMHRRLKTLLQSQQVPPWERGRVVLIHARSEDSADTSSLSSSGEDDVLIAVLSASRYWLADGWSTRSSSSPLS